MVNEQALLEIILNKYKTITQFANVLGRSYISIKLKLTNKSVMTLGDAEAWQKALDINDEEFAFYFLNHSFK